MLICSGAPGLPVRYRARPESDQPEPDWSRPDPTAMDRIDDAGLIMQAASGDY